jgi:hypothetical protein
MWQHELSVVPLVVAIVAVNAAAAAIASWEWITRRIKNNVDDYRIVAAG